MPRLRIATLLTLCLMGATIALADDPPKPTPPVKVEDPLKPLPPVGIPDDPPPHEGAMIDFPVIVEPPDLIVVEVLEALPGKPITGERMVRPDGTISLGFYGDLHVRGLTVQQVKVKILLHLRHYLNDEVLGLIVGPHQVGPLEPLPKPGTIVPIPMDDEPAPLEARPEAEPKKPTKPDGLPSASISRSHRLRASLVRRPTRTRKASQKEIEPAKTQQDPKAAGPGEKPVVGEAQPKIERHLVAIKPEDSGRVFVDIVAHNSKVYYVQGDVGVPGRLPFTGKETVLDALNYAGGFVPTAEPTDIHLYRPARGGKPAKDYRIDINAIYKGDKTANLQIFPDDRLIIGRNPIIKKTIEMDRAKGLIDSQMNTILQFGLTARTIGSINQQIAAGNAGDQIRVNGQNIPLGPANALALTPAQRDAMIKDWAEFLWSISSKEGGAMLDEKAFKEAWIKKLTPSPQPKQ